MGSALHTPPTPRARGLKLQRIPDVREEAIHIIADSSAVYGSHGTALLVATEILVRQKRAIRLGYRSTKKNGASAIAYYKLLPRTVQLIDQLTPIYGTRGKVIDACASVIKHGKK